LTVVEWAVEALEEVDVAAAFPEEIEESAEDYWMGGVERQELLVSLQT